MASPAPRLHFLDWTRIIAFALLILYHVGMYYVSWPWHVKSPQAGPWLEPLMRISSPWRMSLLFLVSGAATAFMLAGRGAGAGWLGARARRLVVPLLFGIAVIVPPQAYLEVVHQHGFQGSYAAFLQLYLTGHGGFCGPRGCLILPTWNHLWFLPYLLVYTVLLWAAVRLRGDALERAARALSQALAGPALLVLPVLALALARVALRDAYPVTHALVGDWYAHAQYLPMFVAGAAMARGGTLWPRIERARRVALGAAVLAWAAIVTDTAGPLQPVAHATQQWCAIVAALGFARRWLNVDHPARAWLNDAVFPVYVVHQTLIVLLAEAARPWALAAPIEGPLIAVATFALGIGIYLLVRRVAWLRPLFGLAPHGAAAPPAATAPAR